MGFVHDIWNTNKRQTYVFSLQSEVIQMFLTASNARYKHARYARCGAFSRNDYPFPNMEIRISTWIYISLYDREVSSVKMCVCIDKFSLKVQYSASHD